MNSPSIVGPLTARLLSSLRNLGDRDTGEPHRWSNIADALELTRLGLAQRERGRWSITPAGARAVLEADNLQPSRIFGQVIALKFE